MTRKVLFVIFILTAVNTDILLLLAGCPALRFRYNGNTWKTPPKHRMTRNAEHNWVKPVVEIVYVTNPKEPTYAAALGATTTEWNDLKYAINLMTEDIKYVITGVRKLDANILIPRRCVNFTTNQKTGYTAECDSSKQLKCDLVAICYDLDVGQQYSDDCYENGGLKYPKGVGSSSDLLIFVSIQGCNELANAISCQSEPEFNRPLAGRIAVCRDTLKSGSFKKSRLKNILLHEFFHIIISPLSGQYYRNPENQYRPYRQPYVIEPRQWLSPYGSFERHAFLLKLPNVIRVVREHFNCPYLLGAELYNASNYYDDDPYNYAHFDSRLFPDTLLSSIYLPGNQLTKLEVALLMDTGWYMINKSAGIPLGVTQGKGCDFATKSCYEFMSLMNFNTLAMHPYCKSEDKNRWMCSLDDRRVAYCAGSFTNEDVALDVFKLNNGLFYGSRWTAYCPMVLPPIVLHGDNTSPVCPAGDDAELKTLDAWNGPDAVCVRFPYLNAHKNKPFCPKMYVTNHGLCVKRKCVENGIELRFAGETYFCSKQDYGRTIEDDLYTEGALCKVRFKMCCPKYDICSVPPDQVNVNASYLQGGLDCGANCFSLHVVSLLLILLTLLV